MNASFLHQEVEKKLQIRDGAGGSLADLIFSVSIIIEVLSKN